jgi:hypothetical protein
VSNQLTLLDICKAAASTEYVSQRFVGKAKKIKENQIVKRFTIDFNRHISPGNRGAFLLKTLHPDIVQTALGR